MTKQEQRTLALDRRRALDSYYRKEASEQICLTLWALSQVQDARTVASYMAADGEVDLSFLHGLLDQKGVRTVFPTCLSHGVMEMREPGSWKQNAYGIWEPDPSDSPLVEPEDLDLVLVPCVAFDSDAHRLGHGAGYYDRYLPRCPKAATIAVAFEVQRLDTVLTEETDRDLDLVLSEERMYRKK